MPSIGERKATTLGGGYANDPIASFAEAFRDLAKDVINESGVDIFMEPSKAVMNGVANETLKNFFVENSADQAAFTNATEYEDHMQCMREQYENDRQALLEYAPTNAFNPVIGMTFPMHKNILMNTVFDKGAIPKFVAREPKFTVTMETRILVKPDGTEIDMFRQQNLIKDAVDTVAPFTDVTLTLPETETTDVLAAISGTANVDNVSIESYISAVQVSIYLAVGDKNPETGDVADTAGAVDVWLPVNLTFKPTYGEYDRTMTEKITIKGFKQDVSTTETPDIKVTDLNVVIMGYRKKNKFGISVNGAQAAKFKKVKLHARLDTSNATQSACSVSWKARTDIIEIPSAKPINTPVSPDEVKDVGALYQVNQLAKIMSLFKLVLSNYKDDTIKGKLDESFGTMPATNKLATTFDFAPPSAYALDPVEWRSKMFMDALDSHVTVLLQVLNDPNVTITVFGRPDLIRKITPTEYTYQTPSSIGPVELDYTKTVVTPDKRVYQFIGSDKLRGNNNLIVILCPRNTDRFIYRIYDYQMYISNEIRNFANPALPAIHAYERWIFSEYQPVQGRVKVLHPLGLTAAQSNTDAIGSFDYSSYSANYEGVTVS